MGKKLRALLVLLLVAACGGGGNNNAPRNLDNACAIARERPNFMAAFRRTERRWGVPIHVQMATIYQESKFDNDARTPLRFVLGVIPMGRQSSAYGFSQALDGTWKEYLRETGRRRAKRDDIRWAADFIGWYMKGTRDRVGVRLDDARNQYLAYHEGRSGYQRGSHNGKAWLLAVADRVEERSQMYRLQLQRCGR